jgi:hypothetical protein
MRWLVPGTKAVRFSPHTHEEEADPSLKRMREENTTRCQNCGHLPM